MSKYVTVRSLQLLKENLYNSSGIGSLFTSLVSSSLSSSEKRTAARAILRHEQHTTDHQATHKPGGLHPMYRDLHGRGNNRDKESAEIGSILTESLEDIFDALTTIDRIDGGISMLLRCPGYNPQDQLNAEDITVDVYVTPREIKEGGKDMSRHIAFLVQCFGCEIVIPHLSRFKERCTKEEITPLPPPKCGKQIKVDGASYLPSPVSKGGPHFCCRCRPAGTLAQDIAIHSAMMGPSPLVAPSSEAADPVKSDAKTKFEDDLDVKNDPKWMHEAVKVASRYDEPYQPSANTPRKSATDGFQDAIISIGPHTDMILDRFRLDDALIPRLCILSCTVRSSKWESTLRSLNWGLSYEQAVKLSTAMLMDMKTVPVHEIKVSIPWVIKFFMVLIPVVFLAIILLYFI